MPTASDTHAIRHTYADLHARMQRDLVAAFDGKGIGLFASLGGSNSLGACDTTGRVRCNQTGFAELTYTALSELGVVRGCPQKQNGLTCGWANGGIGAMGPQLASACTSKFVPVGTRFATIEYLPNLGYTNDDAGELAALEKLLHVLQQRGARVAFVNILPGGAMERFKTCKDGKIGCTRTSTSASHNVGKELGEGGAVAGGARGGGVSSRAAELPWCRPITDVKTRIAP